MGLRDASGARSDVRSGVLDGIAFISPGLNSFGGGSFTLRDFLSRDPVILTALLPRKRSVSLTLNAHSRCKR